MERAKAALERRLVADEQKIAKRALEIQWRLDLDSYADEVTAWREKVATLDAEWREERDQARMAHQRPPQKPSPPTRPKRPIKPKCDLTIIQEGEVEPGEGESVDNQHQDIENEELVEFIRDLYLDRFAQML